MEKIPILEETVNIFNALFDQTYYFLMATHRVQQHSKINIQDTKDPRQIALTTTKTTEN